MRNCVQVDEMQYKDEALVDKAEKPPRNINSSKLRKWRIHNAV